MSKFRALRVREENGVLEGRIETMAEAELDAGDVVIAAHYSSINYKDALGVTGKGRIFKKTPIVGGIDVAGVVLSSANARFKEGDQVLVTGCGLGETHDGGYAERVRVPADWVVPLPKGLTLWEAMAFGTAGFTAGLAVHRLLVNDQTPDKGPILVTGASGGVGSLVIPMLAGLGFDVVAVSGKPEMTPYLKSLGANEVTTWEALQVGKRPLEAARFGGAIDNVGGEMLAGILRHVNLWGNVASIGLAAGFEVTTSVMPFILRGVSVLGISSTNCPMPLRREIWLKLADAWKPPMLESMVTDTVKLSDTLAVFEAMLARKTHGRFVVDCRQ